MCGIAGFLAPPGERADPAVLERMVATLRHRGPDALGYHVDGPAALGIARLSIVDLVDGDQPIHTEDRDITVTLNGEIYDFGREREALLARGHRFGSRSDTEVVAHAWEEAGPACVERLNGMFALAVWDRRAQRLVLARDRMGEKPLYWTARGGWLVFASELRALLEHPAVRPRLALESVARYLAYEYVPDPHGMLDGVAKLPPAHVLVAHPGKAPVLRRYWDIPFAPEAGIEERTWCEEIATRLDHAVAVRLASDVPVGCFVSGGIDSTVVTGLAAGHRPGIRTFSVGYAGSRHDERPFARIAAEHFATDHHELVVTPEDAAGVVERLGRLLDEPLADMSFVPLYLLSRAARGTVTVALTGDGGDELFAGYPMMAAEWWQRAFGRLPAPARRALARGAAWPAMPAPLGDFFAAMQYSPEARIQSLIGGMLPVRQHALLSAEARARLAAFDPYAEVGESLAGCATSDPTARLIYRYCKLYLAGMNLVNTDRASMAAGLELRAPFLDHTFVEFMGRIPSELKLAGFRRLKGLLKRALAQWLPPAIRNRRKQGFGVPFAEWFRGPLAPLVREALAPARDRAGGVFDPAAVHRLVTEHLAGVRDHRRPLWSILAFELWRREYLGDGPAW